MCRTGGRRCPGSGGRGRGGSESAGHAGDGKTILESYQGTPSGRASDGVPCSARKNSRIARIAGGENITNIMREKKRTQMEEQMAQIQREAEQAALDERRGW